ncbi:MAG: diacylglycerol kinase family lipid kinase [Chloroflexi bacterium]|nr:diacylglycerol kinase family lipid kinase [Chloroflexota bacterium]
MNARLIYNPAAGARTTRDQVARAAEEFRARGWNVAISETAHSGDGFRIARQAIVDQLDALIAVGGDGTLNETANALVDSQTALGVLPRGTGNVWAREMGMPLDDLAAGARLIADAEIKTIDVGEVRGTNFSPRIFVLWCGIGFDAAVTRDIETNREMKRRLGPLSFIISGMRLAWQYRGKRVRIFADQFKIRRRVILALAMNVQLYGAFFRLAPNARAQDEKLDLLLFKGAGLGETIWHAGRVFLGSHLRDPQVEMHSIATLNIPTEKLPVQVDGEPIGFTPIEIRVRPRALRVLVPRTANMDLFSENL